MLKDAIKYRGYLIYIFDDGIEATLDGGDVQDFFEDGKFKDLAQCKQWLDEDKKCREEEENS